MRRPLEPGLRAAVAVMHQVAHLAPTAVIDDRWLVLERVQHEISAQRRRHAPADNAPGEDVDDDRDVAKAPPRRDISKVRDP